VSPNSDKFPRSSSAESAAALLSGDKNQLRVIVADRIRGCREQGAIADEICAALELGHNSITPRITELKEAGNVVELYDRNGKRVRRKTRQGCMAGVVVAVDFAPAGAQQFLPLERHEEHRDNG
jgi:DNA-binding transcriptional ArsR family regulator